MNEKDEQLVSLIRDMHEELSEWKHEGAGQDEDDEEMGEAQIATQDVKEERDEEETADEGHSAVGP